MKKITLVLSLVLSLVFVGCASKEAKIVGAPEVVSAYLEGAYQDEASVKSAITGAGLEILGTAKIGKGKKAVTSIVFTHPSLLKMAKAKGREFVAGSMRVLVNKQKNLVSVTNPIYFLKAYMQGDFVLGSEKPVYNAIKKALPNLVEGNKTIEFTALSGFTFSAPLMPGYAQQDELGTKADIATMLKKMKKKAKKKNLVFLQKISDTQYLAGFHLGKRTEKFAKKIGTENAHCLPYMARITINEEGKAVAHAFDAKYYLALTYPGLSMGTFMTIATVPGAIANDLKKYFK